MFLNSAGATFFISKLVGCGIANLKGKKDSRVLKESADIETVFGTATFLDSDNPFVKTNSPSIYPISVPPHKTHGPGNQRNFKRQGKPTSFFGSRARSF